MPLNLAMMKTHVGCFHIGGYECGPAVAVAMAKDYREKTAFRFVAGDAVQARIGPLRRVHSSRKYDGEMCLLFVEKDEAFLVTPGGTFRTGEWPVITAAKALAPGTVLAGELYFSRPSARERVYDVTSRGTAPSSVADVNGLSFAAFDVVRAAGVKAGATFAERREMLEKLVPPSAPLHYAAGRWTDGAGAVADFAAYVGEGAEGVVVRTEDGDGFKVKQVHNLDVVCVGYAERVNEPGVLHDVLFAVARNDGRYHVLGHVGVFSDADRASLLERLRGLQAESDYVCVSSEMVAYTMVRPELVIEIKCLDVLLSNSKGIPIQQMVISYDGKWSSVGQAPLCSLYSPQFVRIRDDKSGPVAVRSLQLEAFSVPTEVPLVDVEAAAAEVIKKAVLVKPAKTGQAVRRVLTVKTNKEHLGYPKFVILATDFSNGRESPLQESLFPAATEASAQKLFDSCYDNFNKRGWTLVAS